MLFQWVCPQASPDMPSTQKFCRESHHHLTGSEPSNPASRLPASDFPFPRPSPMLSRGPADAHELLLLSIRHHRPPVLYSPSFIPFCLIASRVCARGLSVVRVRWLMLVRGRPGVASHISPSAMSENGGVQSDIATSLTSPPSRLNPDLLVPV